MTGVPWSLRGNELLLTVRLTPKSSCDEIDGFARLSDGRAVLKIRVRALPEHGMANEALVRIVAKALHVPASAMRLESGAAGRLKILCVKGDTESLVASLGRLRSAR
ncbi:MAG: DUF167 family protein [Beijerinckiaceae bacterium]|nr:DUF167 family protein [Beijerinckiaceae bacterium]